MMLITRRDYAKDSDLVSFTISLSLNNWYYVLRDSKKEGPTIEGIYNKQSLAEAKFHRITSYYEDNQA